MSKKPIKNKTKNKSTKKSNNVIGTLIIVLTGLIIVCIVGYGVIQNKNIIKIFKKDDSIMSRKTYEQILEISDENYPKTPDEVMQIYADTYKLLYGNKIEDNIVIKPILKKQRVLFSKNLLDKNPFDKQLENIIKNMDNLKMQEVYMIGIHLKPVIYDSENANKAYIRVFNQDNYFKNYYYIYYLERDENSKWKITAWYNTDENYVIKNN